MKTILVDHGITISLKDIGLQAARQFGRHNKEGAKKLTEWVERSKDFLVLYDEIVDFMRTIPSSRRKRLPRRGPGSRKPPTKRDKLVTNVLFFLEEAKKFYSELPELKKEDYTEEILATYDSLSSDALYKVHTEKTLLDKFLAIQDLPEEEKKTIHFIHHCLILWKIQDALGEIYSLLNFFDKMKKE